jgi:SAM-dependent methyltransferase
MFDSNSNRGNAIPAEILQVLRCQEGLCRLEQVEDGLRSICSDRVYPVKNGLIFMGYDEAKHDFMEAIVENESQHQTSPEFLERDTEFVSESCQSVRALIDVVGRHLSNPTGLRAIEIGAGSAWVSFMFALAGYDMWACELDPNSLSISWLYDHPNFGPGKRIVGDATLLPFDDASFDLVICKEFAHHVADKRSLFMESNRILRPGGILALSEPVLGLSTAVGGLLHTDPIIEHVHVTLHRYLREVEKSGFRVEERRAHSHFTKGRIGIERRWRRSVNEATHRGVMKQSSLDDLMLYVFSGQFVAIAKKVTDVEKRSRPKIRPVNPEQLAIGVERREMYRPLVKIVTDAWNRPVTGTVD